MPDSNPTPPDLHGLDPGELLARGLQTVRLSGSMHDWTPPAPEELARRLPQYRIESLLGRGGMGAVYKGFQEKLGRAVALKLLPAELSADQQFVTRFEREAKTLARLQHPGIVSIYDFGRTADGHLYFVMEYVEGTDLRRILEGPGLEPEQALEIIAQICEALHAAHRQGVIHRDIKPANILLTTDGRVKLADFGLARPDRAENEALTLSSVALGTPDYMAPEQRQGRTDLRADIYALGVMLYQMLTGQLPQGAWAPPSRKVSVDVRIDEVVLKALQHEPDLRYQQVSEMKTDVDGIRSGGAEIPRVKDPRRLAWTVVLAAVGVAAAAAFWFADKSRVVSAADAGNPPANPSLDAGLTGGIERPLPHTAGLRRFDFPESDSGLYKQVYLPAKPGFGLIVRLRCAPDLLTESERKQGYDGKTLWEWVQVPPLAGGGNNTVTFTMGTPVWRGDGTDTIRLTSESSIDDHELFSADEIDCSKWTYDSRPDRLRFTFYRQKVNGDTASEEVFLDFEILAVSHEEIKARYPEMRAPGETIGEGGLWVENPVPDDKTGENHKPTVAEKDFGQR